ncbi:hypothetical protein DMUE_0321 [Dictyocoela muelleri]|nr:hypothetical protein DMUE_0321 [Dictyocoela muelleri]
MKINVKKKLNKSELKKYLDLVMLIHKPIIRFSKQRSLINKNNIFVTHDNGFLMMRKERKNIIILEIHVDPNFRSIGIGSKLLQKAKTLFKGKYVLYVNKDNLKAIRFYENNGFHFDSDETYSGSNYFAMSCFI